MSDLIRVHSADSHLMEPDDLWLRALPGDLGRRAPLVSTDGKYEFVDVDGQRMSRMLNSFADKFRPPGALDLVQRLKDLDEEGVVAQLAFPSRGFWVCALDDPELHRLCVAAYNDWAVEEVIARTDRVLPAAMVSTVDIGDAVAEVQRAVGLGFQAVYMPTSVPAGLDYGLDRWDPLWSAVEEAGVVLAFHIGTGTQNVVYRGPGGAVVNYWETCVPGQRVVTHLVAGGALDRHPDLDVLIAEGGASWVPALADRLDEAYRQHGQLVQPKLSMLPSELIFRQVYTSFQHDASAVPAVQAMGYQNVMWGDDYPHLEGTFGHTQATLHQLFDRADADTMRKMTIDNFEHLFDVGSHAGPAATSSAST
jgi:predicted TIM-barrel fold metal-dependent hydrolase